jgi:hypothetical protein
MPTIAANAYRHRIGRPYNAPAPAEMGLTYAENFLCESTCIVTCLCMTM